MDVIVYYRTRPSEPSYSDNAFEEQRAAVRSRLTSHPAAIQAEYIEPETDGFSRPQLRGAIEACKQTGATLLIARTEAIGSGAPFSPRIISVPIAFARDTPRDKGYMIPAPEKAPTGLALYFPDHGNWRIVPVYLCNRTDQAMLDIKVNTLGITTHLAMSTPSGSAPLSTTPRAHLWRQCPAGHHGHLLDRWLRQHGRLAPQFAGARDNRVARNVLRLGRRPHVDRTSAQHVLHAEDGPGAARGGPGREAAHPDRPHDGAAVVRLRCGLDGDLGDGGAPAAHRPRVLEASTLSRFHPLFSTRLACITHPIGACVIGVFGGGAAAAFALLHGAGNGILTIARGTLPLAIFGPENYAYRLGLIGAPSRICQALAPLGFGLLIEPMGRSVVIVSSLLSLAALAALLLLPAKAQTKADSAVELDAL
jgi:hypothetical protein